MHRRSHHTRVGALARAVIIAAGLARGASAAAPPVDGKAYELDGTSDGWLALATTSGSTGAALTVGPTALVQTMVNASPFAPVIYAPAEYDGDRYKKLAFKVTVIGAPGDFVGRVRTLTTVSQSQDFTLHNGTQVVRLTLAHTGVVHWIELDLPASGTYAAFAGTQIRLHWLAVTAADDFRGMAPELIDVDNPANAAGLARAADDRGLAAGELPGYLVVPAQIGYGFATAVEPGGALYAGGYTGSVVRVSPDGRGQLSLFSRVAPYATTPIGLMSLWWGGPTPQLWAANEAQGDVRPALGGAAILGGTGGIRPRQLSGDASGAIYVAWEGSTAGAGFVERWTPSGRAGITPLFNLPLGVTIAGGAPYAVTHTLTDGRFDDQIRGAPLDPFTGGVAWGAGRLVRADFSLPTIAGGTLDGFWRARGVAADTRAGSPYLGHIYVAEEGNAWDQGNSGRLARVVPATGAITPVLHGVDYPQFPTYSPADGRVYFALPHDGVVGAYDPQLAFASTASGVAGVAMSITGGTFAASAGGPHQLVIYDPTHPADQVAVRGTFAPGAGGRLVSGWLRVPGSALPRLSRAKLGDEVYAAPAVTPVASVGRLRAVAFPLRAHRGHARWPATTGPAPDYVAIDHAAYDDHPDEYLVFYQWTDAGVAIGASTLIGARQLADSFSMSAVRACTGEVPPAGSPALALELPSTRSWQAGRFAFVQDTYAWSPYPGSSNTGSALGMTQSVATAVDWGVAYGLGSDFVVQVDAVQTDDRIDLTASSQPGTIGAAGGLSVFFRASGHGPAEVGVYVPGQAEHVARMASGAVITTGIAKDTWHNYAVRFDLVNRRLWIYVDEALRGVVELATLDGGALANAITAQTSAYVSVGYAQTTFGRPVWTDNFQVGTPAP